MIPGVGSSRRGEHHEEAFGSGSIIAWERSSSPGAGNRVDRWDGSGKRLSRDQDGFDPEGDVREFAGLDGPVFPAPRQAFHHDWNARCSHGLGFAVRDCRPGQPAAQPKVSLYHHRPAALGTCAGCGLAAISLIDLRCERRGCKNIDFVFHQRMVRHRSQRLGGFCSADF